jgi:hypothetical protein
MVDKLSDDFTFTPDVNIGGWLLWQRE